MKRIGELVVKNKSEVEKIKAVMIVFEQQRPYKVIKFSDDVSPHKSKYYVITRLYHNNNKSLEQTNTLGIISPFFINKDGFKGFKIIKNTITDDIIEKSKRIYMLDCI